LTPAYSIKIVHQILQDLSADLSVLDPFSGTATTTLCAVERGHKALSVEINPFLVWFGKAKVRQYCLHALESAKRIGQTIERTVQARQVEPAPTPPIANVERWWDADHLDYLRLTRAAIEAQSDKETPVRDLLDIAFCRSVIGLSNAAFNHQSVSFKDTGRRKPSSQLSLWDCQEPDGDGRFARDLDFILETARKNPPHSGRVVFGDSRNIAGFVEDQYDILITSPPYPNRMSYIRELRPYMYWLRYLTEARQAGELDWEAIGGTWGIATSRLSDWRPDGRSLLPSYLEDLLDSVVTGGPKSGQLLANYIHKYFEDMWHHFQSITRALRSGAEVHYIVGNSKFYDVLIPVERIYVDMLGAAGFKHAKAQTIRKRNSKKELFEFDVSAIYE